ncbi:DNA-binding transcriptional regulator IdnR [Citrobacter amalonaticus]|uniref:DNA-binding transcriptional regulator IdnR n=1 Tax=Citrobacter amalonaticus TaxID=35703 RepID=UPI0007339EAF|nr:LacI family DNA-binding transcriptional regulator [Citrobacter amalonaticus]EKX8493775.1 LacI family DNA-binding transcriptional regulator [Citrobacter amalonaticus]ELO0859924.1 LacI family DNA-binding transcriptional regulator [Citrobacter amalonaticus]PNP33357.1 LacI family DNA-binding transcriptional regulator [Citrobacter amalonaticus]
MRNHRISLQDIATLAGVTKMTVSRYIRSPKKVAKETGERIAQIMEEINYIPNRAPAMLLNAQSYTLGVLIPSFQNQLFADILAGIESVTSDHNYQTLIANYNYDCESEEESVINLLSYNIDGIILSEKYHTLRTVKFLRSAAIPIIELMDIQGDRLDMEVGFDNRQAAFDMVSTMLDKRQRRKILYLGSKDDIRDEQRFRGYCDAMTRRGLTPLRVNPKAISSIRLGMQLMRDALIAHPDLDGVFCTNDDIAMGALLFCRERDLSVPEQVSIAGFHGLEMGRQMIPSLASVITPRFDIGRMAAQMLLSKIKNNDHNHNTIDLGYQIYHGNTL